MRRSGILDGLWRAWPVLNWLLPVLFSAHGVFSAVGGWAWSFLLFTAPIVIPACGLLGMLPMRQLRGRGYDTVPWRIGILLLVNWWAAFATILFAIDTLSRQATAGGVPSLLRLLGASAPSIGFELGALGVAALLVLASWAGVCFLVARAPEGGVSDPPADRDLFAVRVTAIVLLLLLVGSIAVGAWATAAPRDSAGEISDEVRSEPIVVQVDRALTRYDGFQQTVSEVRAAIAADGWQTTPPYGFDPLRRDCAQEGPRCYGFQWGYRIELGAGVLDLDAFRTALDDAGWTIQRQTGSAEEGTLDVQSADGDRIVLTLAGGRLDLAASSAWWWGDAGALREALPDAGSTSLPVAVSGTEWPPLLR